MPEPEEIDLSTAEIEIVDDVADEQPVENETPIEYIVADEEEFLVNPEDAAEIGVDDEEDLVVEIIDEEDIPVDVFNEERFDDAPSENDDHAFPGEEHHEPSRGTAKLFRRQANIPWRHIGELSNFREDLHDIEALALSIKERGLIAPLVVRENPTGEPMYQLVAGYRRLAAWKYLHADDHNAEVLCEIIEGLSEHEAYELMFLENVQREPLEPMQAAKGLQALLDQNPDWTIAKMARSLGLRTGWIRRHLRMLDLPESVQEKIAAGDLSSSLADLLRQAQERGDVSEAEVEEIAEQVAEGDVRPGEVRERLKPHKEPKIAEETTTWETTIEDDNEPEVDKEMLDIMSEAPTSPGGNVYVESADTVAAAQVQAPAAHGFDLTPGQLEGFLLGRLVAQYGDEEYLRSRDIQQRSDVYRWAFLLTEEEVVRERQAIAAYIVRYDDDPFDGFILS